MRKENLLCIGLVVSLLIGAAAVNIPMVHAVGPRIYIDPSTTTTRPSSTFTISLKAADVSYLSLYNVTIEWNGPFNLVSVTEGDFLKTGGEWFYVIGPWGGGVPWELDIGCWASPGVSGSGTLATLTFECVGIGETSIHFRDYYVNIPCDFVDGYLYSDRPLPPEALFTRSPVTAFMDDPISFDASGSLLGWSGAAETPIVNYAWDFESDGIVDAYGVDVTHAFPSAGTYEVSLKVTDSQGLWGTEAHPSEIILRLHATVDIAPDSLNLKSKGDWITCYIELPAGYHVGDISVPSLMLNGTVRVAPLAPTAIGDYDNDGIPDLMVKFSRDAVISYVLANIDATQLVQEGFMAAALTITGNLNDGTAFRGSDTIKVIRAKTATDPIPI